MLRYRTPLYTALILFVLALTVCSKYKERRQIMRTHEKLLSKPQTTFLTSISYTLACIILASMKQTASVLISSLILVFEYYSSVAELF